MSKISEWPYVCVECGNYFSAKTVPHYVGRKQCWGSIVDRVAVTRKVDNSDSFKPLKLDKLPLTDKQFDAEGFKGKKK
jgi:hypothetical protein